MQSGKPVVVIGGGTSGITAAVEAAEAGTQVILLEREAYLGGRVFRMNKYFPKLCPPQCGMEINFQRIRSNPNIRVITSATVKSVSGSAGNFKLEISTATNPVNNKCTACGDCVPVCPVETVDDFNYSMSKRKAVYMSHPMAYPNRFIIDMKTCKGAECSKCVDACKYKAIEFGKPAEEMSIDAASVVIASGWKPYDAGKIENLGFGSFKNVITNVMMERLASPGGPTGGKITRPSDGKEVRKVAFVQCAGSRDENHLPYCSAVCCLASLKQATYVREAIPDAEVIIFYIDMRTPGKYEAFMKKVSGDEKVSLVKGKVAKITEDSSTKEVILSAEDVMGGEKIEYRADLAVLATGMAPSLNGEAKNLMVQTDENGFILTDKLPDGISVAGVAERPVDVVASVMGGTAAALNSLQWGGK